ASRAGGAAPPPPAGPFAGAGLGRGRFRDGAGGSAGPWLFGIARHVLSVSVRRRALERSACERLGVLERLDRPAATTEPDESWLDGIDEALSDLPQGQRRAIQLRVLHDPSFQDVASERDT